MLMLLIALLACRCARVSRQQSSTLTVLAAASLAEPFEEIGNAFEAQPKNMDVAVEFSFAGSQQLARQIGQGAPADVFAAANQQ